MATSQDGTFCPSARLIEKKEPERALVAVTVKMISGHEDFPDEFYTKFLACPVTVHLVGRSVNIRNTETSSEFALDDGTGVVAVTYWFPVPGVIPHEMQHLSEGGYLHAVGKVDKTRGRVSLHAFSCWKVVDFNDITLHFLESIHAYLVRVGPPKSLSVGSVKKVEEQQEKFVSQVPTVSTETNEFGNNCETIAAVVGPEDSYIVDEFFDGENININQTQEEERDSGLLDSISEMLKRCKTSVGMEGVAISAIVAELGVEESIVRVAIGKLEEVGEIYQTVDGDHYSAT